MISAKDGRVGQAPRKDRKTLDRRNVILGLLLMVTGLQASAQDGLFSYQEYEKRVKSAQNLAAISADQVFGDRTSSFDGNTEFFSEDVSIPGNFDLAVSVARRFGVESANRGISDSEARGLTLFDDWEIVVPHMSGVWTTASGWVTGQPGAQTTQRCTTNVAPTLVDTWGYADIGFGIDVKWQGGSGEELLVPDDPAYASSPELEPPKWMTASRARFTCLAATRNGYPGEAFVGHTPDGKKYFFDWGVDRPYATAKFNDGASNKMVARKRVYLLASRVEDRYGNWVEYSYSGYKLTSIQSSDGRRIDLAYDAQDRVTTVTANGRVWRYSYVGYTDANDGGLSQVTLPDGSAWSYSHGGRLPGLNERKLLQRQILDPTGQLLRDETYAYTFGSETGPFARRVGRSLGIQSGQFLAGTLAALSESQTVQDGDTYRTLYSDFNRNARASRLTYVGPSGTKAEVRAHVDTSTPWVQDQVLSVTEAATGKVTTQYTYDAMAKPNAVYRAGALVQSVVYGADGSVSEVADGKGNQTRIEDWYRGVPRRVVNPDGTINGMTADANGWITSTTDTLGRVTSYSYDPMGRTREIQPPVDANQWTSTVVSFRQIGVDEYGLPPGHWRVDTSHGAYRQETYLDALWQPRLVREYDANDPTNTQRFVRNDYDTEGRQTFTSYPSREASVSSGTWQEYDALGRKTSSAQDSEQGLLITAVTYGSNATTTVVDPAGHQTITRFDAFGSPDYDKPAQITRPDGSKISITRNAFGLTTEVAQSAN